MLPPWALVDGKSAIKKRLSDENTRAEIRKALARDAEDGSPGYWEGTLVTYCDGHPEYSGRNVYDLAQEMGKSPEDAVMDILLYSNINAGMVQFAMSEENVEYGLQQDFVMIGSDGEGRAVEGALSTGKPHPRNYGTFPRVLGYFSRQKGIFPLETAVYKMTGLPAKRIGLQERGLLKPGYYADITIFNRQTVIDEASFIDPHQYAQGIEYVLVNGKAVIEKGAHTHALPGQVLVH
jgi:N-acyl-D-amino-acid deacylase